MGKSELLKNIAIQDIQEGRGLAFVDPHGDPVEDLLDYIPPERIKDVIYINPADIEHPIAFNVMESVDPDKRHLIADGIMAVFKKLWIDAWSARMEYILNYTILALLEVPGTTLLGINRMLAEKDYRKTIVEQINDPEVKAFWTKEFAGYTERYTAEAVPAIQNKIGQFISNTLIRNMIGQPNSSFDMRKAMDEGKILLVNISKGRVGEDASRLLGGLLITKIQLAAMSRVDIPKEQRKDFVLVVDEFQNFATASFANILSEARKFNLSLVVAHQYVAQMDEEVADAVFGNVGTIVSFRVGAEDAEMLEKEFSPEFIAQDIVNLGKRQIYLKLMIDGVASKAFSAMTMDTIAIPEQSTRGLVIEQSRSNYGRVRKEVEEAVAAWRLPLTPVASVSESPRPQFRRTETRSSEPRRPARSTAGSERIDRPRFKDAPLSALHQESPKQKREERPKASVSPAGKKEVDHAELRKILQEALEKQPIDEGKE